MTMRSLPTSWLSSLIRSSQNFPSGKSHDVTITWGNPKMKWDCKRNEDKATIWHAAQSRKKKRQKKTWISKNVMICIIKWGEGGDWEREREREREKVWERERESERERKRERGQNGNIAPISQRTFDAPASNQSLALSTFTPPPTCRAPGHVAKASFAASVLPGPSWITWPPVRPSRRYSPAKWEAPWLVSTTAKTGRETKNWNKGFKKHSCKT